jgi:hypothetical protein
MRDFLGKSDFYVPDPLYVGVRIGIEISHFLCKWLWIVCKIGFFRRSSSSILAVITTMGRKLPRRERIEAKLYGSWRTFPKPWSNTLFDLYVINNCGRNILSRGKYFSWRMEFSLKIKLSKFYFFAMIINP